MIAKLCSGALLLSSFFISSLPGWAQSPTEAALRGCATEIEQYCKSVAPGEGRLLACMKAHEDKLSEKCVASIVRAEFQINSSALIMNYLATQCMADAKQTCPELDLGDGRVITCLIQNFATLKERCSLALKDIGAAQ